MIEILIGGDVCPTGCNESAFINGDVETIFGDTLSELSMADISAINLECPLVSRETPIEKSGPVLGVRDSCINAISKAGIDIVNLANNHIMDHGVEGLSNTISVLDKYSISHVGAGVNLEDAKSVLIKNVNGTRIAFYAVAEHEFSIATDNCAGANPLNIIDFVRIMETNKDEWDYLVILVHGGNEGYPYPNPFLRDVCRFFVEQGANSVICQHSHCPGCYETYRDGHIVYGQGNLCFDNLLGTDRSWHEGFFVRLSLEAGSRCKMDIIPFVQTESGPGIHLMGGEKLEQFLRVLSERSSAILDNSFIEEQWRRFCTDRKKGYLNTLLGNGSFASRLAGKLGLAKYFCTRNALIRKLNLIRCESHREILIKILSDEFRSS